MEVNKAEIDAVLDAQGRFVWTPNALTLDGQRNVPCDLQDGESLDAFLRRHVLGIDSGAWSVSIGGAVVPRAMWAKTSPKHGMLIACRATVGRQAVSLVAIAALTYFSGGLAAGLYGAMGGTYVMASAGMTLAMIQSGIVLAGSLLINKVLGPKVPKAGEVQAARQVYGLSGQRNSARAYEPVPVLFGEMRVTPDLASQPYTWYESDDQYLSTILLGGVNVHSAEDLSIGDTPITSYQEVDVYYNGFAGMQSQSLPLHSNADSVAGGELSDEGTWVQRTSSVDAINLQVDIEYAMYLQGTTGLLWVKSELKVEYRPVGTPNWLPAVTRNISSNATEPKRLTLRWAVSKGQYDVRVRQTKVRRSDGNMGGTRNVAWTTLRTVQPDTTDYTQFGRIGIKIKATGQISGSLDTVRATYRAKPMPVWTGTAWATATTRENGLSNPGAIILLALRGIWHKGNLQFGFGLSDDQIDIDGLKAFMLHCTAKGYTYDKWITSSMSLQEFCQEVALAGMGEFSWTDGSRPTVVFVSAGQPVSAVVNMANMLKASFSVDYALSNAADGIEYQYVDRAKNFETVTLRVSAPGVSTALNPARITGEGVTNEAHAAVMARYHLAQSLYQYKTIGFGADIEHLDYRRLSLLSVSHDLTQWGFGGRLEGISVGNGYIQVQLGEAVPALSTPRLGLRLPGGRDYRVWPVQEFAGESDTLILLGDWPEGVPVPGAAESDPVHDTLWCYDFKSTPGYRVRVTSMEPEGDLKGAKVTCVPEGPEFWDYVLNGNYVPAPNQSALPQLARPAVHNLRVSEQTNMQGNTRWWQLSVVWDTQGAADYCQVWSGLDGSELVLVDASATGNRSSWRIDEPGEYLVQVRPFDASGRAGDAASVLYVTAGVALSPANASNFVVQELAGGLRRFAWSFAGDVPVAFAGVQIRYAEGDTSVSADSWDDLTPLGEADDIYTAQFETTKPPAGLYTFALRTINTSGQLSASVARFVASLSSSFEQVQQIDLTPPPAVTGLAVVAGLAAVQVHWDAPIYSQGHGHARTELWAATQGDLQQAAKMAESYAGPVSFSAEPATTYYVWARNVTTDGVAGEWAGPVSDTTGQNPAKLLEVLEGEITESHLYSELSKRIDIIDIDGGSLGRTLVDAASHQDALNQSVRTDMNDMAQGLLEAALAADAALERITDAGVYVDPATGTVKIYGLEVTKGEVTNLQVLLDTLSGQLQLKATTAYVDGKIAEAALSPADLLLYEGLDARLVAVTQTLDSINGVLSSKASQLELSNALVRLTTAESELDALQGEIALRVTRAEYEAGQNAVNSRLGSAELLLSTLDAPSITATVLAAARGSKDAEKNAQALLQDILTADRNHTETQQALAFARSELSAAIQEGLQAEAQQRTQLATQFGQQMSVVEQSLTSLSTADLAEATARQQLASRLDNMDGELLAAIQTEQQARVDAVSAEASARQTLAATVSSNHSTALAAAQAASDAAGSKGKVLFQSSAPAVADRLAQNLWIDTTGGANTPKRWNGSTWAVVTDKAATDAAAAAAAAQTTANNAVAAIQTEQSVRASETGHLGAQYTVRMQLGQGGQQVVGGFGLSGTSSGTAGARIDFGVLANSFWVAAPNGSSVANVKPFSVQTTAQTVNGVVVPAGVYMDAAYINNATVLWGRFGTLVADSIQATAISASQLTAGNGVIGGTLRSSNYVAGSSGWTLRPDGVAEFSGVTVRGTVYATAGTVGGWSIGSNYLRSSNYASGVRGVSFGSDGTVEIRSADGARVLNMQATGSQPVLAVPGLSILGNGSATFSGNLSAASGSFSGTLTADNIVNTSHMVDGAASAGVSVYLAGEVTFSNYDTQVEVASVAFNGSGGRVLALVGLGISASGGVTSSQNPLIRVRLLRNGVEVRRIDVPAEMYTVSNESGTRMYSRVTGAAFTLPPLTDSPGVGWHSYSVTVEARQMGTSVSVTARQRGLAILEMKR
ncbi:host specificity factor TipJ family phage tail protein [Comamonas aquatica]|uniref:host specificity factor TipJ family phage tail protein n=1 Tax=Comamonas aquatica TaxID=225991 RepID=UPI00244C1B18|nr:host specificity factor TipJ family phage tail protein [Comamonas aquatica]MDH1765222.1 host specificity factor TipJ family phage tail protein [Comamonas aquatica]